MKFVVSVALCLLLQPIRASKPVISGFHFPESLTSGQRVIITCSVLEGDPPIRLKWRKDQKELSLSDVEILSLGELGSSLLFRKVARHHSGLYTCIASNAQGNDSFSSQLQVRAAPQWTVEPKDKTAVVGQNIRFDCQSDGFPLPVIRWKLKTGSDLEFRSFSSNYKIQNLENSSLVLKSVIKDDQGLYMCFASNGIGKDISRVIQLIVKEIPFFKQNFQIIKIQKFESIDIKCETFGEKPIQIKWTTKDDRSDVTLKFSKSELETKEGLISRLTLTRAQRQDSGLISCLASNAFGQSEKSFQVVVEEPPDAPKDLTLVLRESRKAVIEWKTPFDGNLEINRYSVEFLSKRFETKENYFTLNDLEPRSEVKVRVLAINSLGASVASELVFYTEEEIPFLAPKDIIGVALSSRSLKISWKKDMKAKGYYVKVNEEKSISTNQEIVFKGLKPKTNYKISVQSFNSKGAGPLSEEIFVETFSYDCPLAPILYLSNVSSDVTSVNLSWTTEDDKNPISGFRLFSRIIGFDWNPILLSSLKKWFLFTSLECGQRFHFYLIAFNDFCGSSLQSNQLEYDLSSAQVGRAPNLEQMFRINSSRVDLMLNSWQRMEFCSVNYFKLIYRSFKSSSDWIRVEIKDKTKVVTIDGLLSGKWYSMIISAHFNEKLFSQKQYVFSTLTLNGGTVSPISALSTADRRLSRYLILMIPILCAVSVLLVIGFVVIYICLRKTETTVRTINTISMNEIKREIPFSEKTLRENNEYEMCSQCLQY